MNFLFVDQIVEFEAGKRAKGLKHVVSSEPHLRTNSEGRLVLSPCIIGEALGQLTAWITMQASDFSLRPVAGILDEGIFYKDAYLGDTIVLNTEIEHLDGESVVYNSFATVSGEKIFELKHSMGPMLPMEDFIDVEQVRQQFNMIYRLSELPFQEDHSSETFSLFALPKEVPDPVSFFDSTFDYDSDGLKVKKKISLLEPYFVDHFPRKPVLPLTLLLDGKLALADYFLKNKLGEAAAKFSLKKVCKVRIKQFIMPGDVIVVALHLKKQTEESCTFSFKTHVGEKVICRAEAVFSAD